MSVREFLGHRSTLVMYRDCLKAAPMMSPGNEAAIKNIKQHFRYEFEMQRHKTEEEHEVFRSGIVRMLSNFMAYEIKSQYLENPGKFQRTTNIHEPEEDETDNSEGTKAAEMHNPFA